MTEIGGLSTALVAANTGIMVFFTVAVAPSIFKVLPPEWAAKYVRSFFPKYYLFLGVTTLGAALLAADPAHQISLAACALVFFISRFWLTPRINLARDENRTGTFQSLHYTSVALNLLQLAVFIWILVKYLG